LFLGVVQAQQLERVAEENVSRAAHHLQDARARVEAGVAPGFDVIRAEAEVANANDGLVAARAAVEKALAALKTLLSIEVTRPVVLQASEPGEYVEVEPSEQIKTALSQRPEVAISEKAVQLADAAIGLARAGTKPSLDMFASFQKQSEKGFGGHDWNWALGVQASKFIFDNGLTRAAVEEAMAKKAQAEEALKQVQEGIALEVYQACVSLNEARERITAAEKAVAQAEEAMRIADLRYREGVAPAVEVTDARLALVSARANLVNARFAYERAKVELAYAIGTPIDQHLDQSRDAEGGGAANDGDTSGGSGTRSSGLPGRTLPVANCGLESRPGAGQHYADKSAATAASLPAHGRYQTLAAPKTP
jgi:outer membrane protein TolC